MITAILLSAGRSRRMGRPKALLAAPSGGSTLLEHAVKVLRGGGADRVVVVAGGAGQPGWQEIRRRAAAAGARVVVNPDPASHQIESLRAGLRALGEDVEAVLATPVDLPGLDERVVRAVVAAWRGADAEAGGAPPRMVVPVHRGRRGHPVLFARAVFPELLHDRLPEGARSVIARHADRVREVEVHTPGIHQDVDTPADYHRVVGRAVDDAPQQRQGG